MQMIRKKEISISLKLLYRNPSPSSSSTFYFLHFLLPFIFINWGTIRRPEDMNS